MIRRVKLLTEQQLDVLTDAHGARAERRDRALVEVLYGSAIRVGELCALDVGDLNLDGAAANVLGKGGKRRSVPLTPVAVAALRELLVWRREGPVFRRADDTRLTPRLAREIVGRRAARAGLPHSSPHTLRHSCASHMLRRGAYLFTVQDLLGHAHPQTTAVYLHRMPVDRSAADDYRAAHPRA
jgi:integrase/recombinase XerC